MNVHDTENFFYSESCACGMLWSQIVSDHWLICRVNKISWFSANYQCFFHQKCDTTNSASDVVCWLQRTQYTSKDFRRIATHFGGREHASRSPPTTPLLLIFFIILLFTTKKSHHGTTTAAKATWPKRHRLLLSEVHPTSTVLERSLPQWLPHPTLQVRHHCPQNHQQRQTLSYTTFAWPPWQHIPCPRPQC